MPRFTPVLPTFCGPKSERCEVKTLRNTWHKKVLRQPDKGYVMRSSEPRVGGSNPSGRARDKRGQVTTSGDKYTPRQSLTTFEPAPGRERDMDKWRQV